MLCLKKRRTYSFTQGVCSEHTRRAKKESNNYGGPLNSAITTLPRKNRNREERPSRMVLTVTEDTPADMLAGSMELLVQLPREHHLHTQKVTVQRSTPMMDLLVQIATAHKLAASSYTLQAIGERGLVLPHQPNTPIGALDALQVKLLPKQGTFVPRKTKQANQPFETTFRLQVHLPRNQLYVSRVSPKMNLGEILDEVCREKNLDRSKYELRHPANLEETLDLSLSLQDYHLQEVTLYAKQGRSLGSALSTQDIMALQRQEERRRHQAKQGVFGFIFKKSKESSLSTDSLGGRSTSPARSDETARSTSPLQPPARPQRKRRPAPKPPAQNSVAEENASEPGKDKVVISHSRNSSDSSGYHEASVLSDNPDSAGRLPETLPRRNRAPGAMETPRKLAHTSQSSKSLGNLATVSGTLSHAASSTSLSSTGLRKKRAAPPPPASRPLSSAISSQALERIVDSEESLTSDMEPSKPPSDIGASSKACSDIEERPKASSDIGVSTVSQISSQSIESKLKPASHELELKINTPPVPQNPIPPGPVEVGQPEVPGTPEAVAANLEHCTPELPAARVTAKRDPLVGPPPQPMPRKANVPPRVPKRRLAPLSTSSRASSSLQSTPSVGTPSPRAQPIVRSPDYLDDSSSDDVFLTPCVDTKDVSRFNGLRDEIKPKEVDKNEIKDSEPSVRRKVIIEKSPKEEEKVCAVISTLPKCEHLDQLPEDLSDAIVTKNNEKDTEKEKRMKIYRMPSKSNDFETNSLERQKRHLTCEPEDITFALNLNLSPNVDLTGELTNKVNNLVPKKDQSQDACSLGTDQENDRLMDSGITADIEPGPLDTEVLLQKVSDTLLNSLPLNEDETNPPRSKSEIPLEKIQPTPVSLKESKDTQKKSSGQVQQDTTESLEEVPLNNSAGSGTATSQQDTSDYVSAVDEDLSIPDWEYQLPAPPSAFRDRNSPVFDEYDTITLGSVEAFKDPIAEIVDDERTNKISNDKPLKRQEKDIRKDMVEEKPVKHLKKSDSNVKLQKEMICELENKIVSGTMSQGIRETDSRKVDILSTPKVAPVDNTLANFTITTYSRPKSVNIFDEVDHSANNKVSDDRFMRSFPTLTRNRINYENDVQTKDASNAVQRSKAEFVSLNDVELRKPQPKREEVSERCQSVKGTTEKVTVQRSRSYISSSESTRHTIHENDTKCDDSGNASGELDKKKSTSTVTLANMHKGNEKFSQWRENILKRQEEPTKEKQLQSLQVLKSILPQLKSAQQPEENVSKETSETVLTEKLTSETGSNEHSTETNVVSTRESQKPSNPTVEVESKKVAPEEKQVKKYTYSGPPAISLGSWSERPTLNVQIKKDTDYKFGGVHKTIGGKTIVNLNGLKDERTAENVLNKEELVSDKKNPSDLARKLITHTTASGFKKPVLNRVNVEARPVDKPVVTGVELKKTFTEKNESYKNNDSAIDTSPVDFRELSRAFGQDVCLRPKPKRLNPNRRTEHFDSNPESLHKLDSIIKQNGHCDIQNSNTTTSESSTKPKRFTSVVGITQSNTSTQATNFPFRSGITVKSNVAMPVVKGFKISSAKTNETQKVANGTVAGTKSIPQPPKPPTMPVITGVTLKSARPKSMPVQIEPRDMLLESIRNFGGRENLKSASGTC